MLDKIREMLQALEHGPVFYGAMPEGAEKDLDTWDYIVFSRVKDNIVGNKTTGTPYYRIGMVAEDYIPEDLVEKIVDLIGKTPGIHLTNDPIEYDYARKPSTSTVVEVAYITLCSPGRCCG